MNETYQNRITDQICKIQTDKKLIAFYDKLLTTTYNSFAQLSLYCTQRLFGSGYGTYRRYSNHL